MEVVRGGGALGLLQRTADQERADSASEAEESENDEVLVSGGEELEEVDESKATVPEALSISFSKHCLHPRLH